MPNLYLTEQGSILRKTGDRLLVQKDDQLLLDVQCHKIETVLIFGNVQFTTQAVHELFEHGIELALLTRTGKLIGQLTPIMPKNITLRMTQYQRYHEPEFTTSFSRSIVKGKLRNSLAHIKDFACRHKSIDLDTELDSLRQKLDSADNCQTTDQLLGIEGTAAKTYFNAFGKMILSETLHFNGRQKHPSPDPVNALLSFGYTLLFNEINSLLDGIGFDPYIGFYHKIEYGRPSLACDLIEEFRAPLIDRFTLSLINNKIFSPRDFYPHRKSGGMFLQHESLKTYLGKYEACLQREFTHPQTGENSNFRKAIRGQIDRLQKAIMDGVQYQPLVWA